MINTSTVSFIRSLLVPGVSWDDDNVVKCRVTIRSSEGEMLNQTEAGLSAAESRDLHRIAGMMIPPSEEFGVPGAGDSLIFADILKSLGRDLPEVRAALSSLAAQAGGSFGDLDDGKAQGVANAFLERGGPEVTTLGRVILQCYYRDDRVVRSLGLEPRPPFPKGHILEQGDWSLLEPVRARPKMWRDAP
jgi:hypothetical protein